MLVCFGDMFTDCPAILLIRSGHHLVGGAPDLLELMAVVLVVAGYRRQCIGILLEYLFPVLGPGSVFRV